MKKAVLLVLVVLLALSAVTLAQRLVVGVSVPTLANPFWQNYVGFVNNVAAQLGIEVRIVDCENNEGKQIMDIENLIAAGVDGLIVTPQTAQVGPAIIRRAELAGVPIAITDRWPGIDPTEYAWDGFVGFIGPDDVDTGFKIAETLIKELGMTNIVGINGVQGASVAEGRHAGLAQAVEVFPEANLLAVEWIGETPDLGIQVTENFLAAYGGSFSGIWCYNDALAVGAVRALRDAGLGEALQNREIAVVGMDLNPDAVERIEEGWYYASFGGHWLQGGFGLIMLYDYMNGKPPLPEYRVARLQLMKVTQENVADFKEQFIFNPPEIDATELSRALNPEATGRYFFEIAIQ